MFCGKCGTRLASAPAPAPAQQNPYSQAHTAAPAQPYSGYTPPQRNVYTPTPPPADTSANPYVSQMPSAPARPSYPSYGSSMMQSPYITGAARSSAPVLSSSRDGAAQYTAVSTNVYSPQAKAAAMANEQASKRKKTGSIILTIVSVVLLLAMVGFVYFSGIFEQPDNSIYIPESSGTAVTHPTVKEPENDTPAVSDGDTVSESDTSIGTSDSDVVVVPDNNTGSSSGTIPDGLSEAQFTDINAFLSAFTETGTNNIDGSVSSGQLVSFAVAGLSMNSSVYSAEDFSIGDITYKYSFSETFVNQRISRYFGENVKIYPAIGDSGDGWTYYGSKYYFTDICKSQGFAIVTAYSANGELVTVSFNVYGSVGNDSDYYSMTAAEVENAGCTLIGSGSAVLGKVTYNGRSTYVLQSINTNIG